MDTACGTAIFSNVTFYQPQTLWLVEMSPIPVTSKFHDTSSRDMFMSQLQLMMTSSNGNIFRVTGHLWGEFTGPRWHPAQRPVTRSFDVFFDLLLYKRLRKRSWGWWFETLSCPLWRHRNMTAVCIYINKCRYHDVFTCEWPKAVSLA